MRSLALVGSALLLAACEPSGMDYLQSKYTNSPEVFAELRDMIIEDTRQSNCMTVGVDKIGEYWWHNRRWVRAGEVPPAALLVPHFVREELTDDEIARLDKEIEEKSLSLEEVLAEVRIELPRYKSYIAALKEVRGKRVTYCRESHKGEYVSVLVHSSGVSVAGCSGDIEWGPPIPEPEGDPSTSNFILVSDLGEGWYLRKWCT